MVIQHGNEGKRKESQENQLCATTRFYHVCGLKKFKICVKHHWECYGGTLPFYHVLGEGGGGQKNFKAFASLVGTPRCGGGGRTKL